MIISEIFQRMDHLINLILFVIGDDGSWNKSKHGTADEPNDNAIPSAFDPIG